MKQEEMTGLPKDMQQQKLSKIWGSKARLPPRTPLWLWLPYDFFIKTGHIKTCQQRNIELELYLHSLGI